MNVRVVAVGIGSVGPPSKFAWAAFDAPNRDITATGDDPETAAKELAAALREGMQAALLLESPMSNPVPSAEMGWRLLGKARAGEANRPWSAGAGAGVLATGLAQGAWLLEHLATALPGLTATTNAAVWRAGEAQLLLAEAFVPGTGKPVPVPAGQHAADAAAAGLEMVVRLVAAQELTSDVRCSPHRPFNLLAALAVWAGLTMNANELREEVLVIRVRPDPTANPHTADSRSKSSGSQTRSATRR